MSDQQRFLLGENDLILGIKQKVVNFPELGNSLSIKQGVIKRKSLKRFRNIFYRLRVGVRNNPCISLWSSSWSLVTKMLLIFLVEYIKMESEFLINKINLQFSYVGDGQTPFPHSKKSWHFLSYSCFFLWI